MLELKNIVLKIRTESVPVACFNKIVEHLEHIHIFEAHYGANTSQTIIVLEKFMTRVAGYRLSIHPSPHSMPLST